MTDHRLDVLADLADDVAARKTASPEQSYTAKLLSLGVEACAKKLGEEAVETALAGVLQDKGRIAAESADLLYHLLVLLEAAEVRLADVMDELARRKGTSGIAEKASRRKD